MKNSQTPNPNRQRYVESRNDLVIKAGVGLLAVNSFCMGIAMGLSGVHEGVSQKAANLFWSSLYIVAGAYVCDYLAKGLPEELTETRRLRKRVAEQAAFFAAVEQPAPEQVPPELPMGASAGAENQIDATAAPEMQVPLAENNNPGFDE